MTVKVRDFGTWKTATPFIKDGGVWKPIIGGFVKKAGAWIRMFPSAFANVIANTGVEWAEGSTPPPTNLATGTLGFLQDGSISHFGANSSGSNAWLNAVAAGNGTPFWIKADISSGTLSSGVTGVWQQMNTSRFFTKEGTTGNGNCVLSISFSTDSAGASIVSSGNIWTVKYSHNG